VIADEQALVIINLRKRAKVILTRESEVHQVDWSSEYFGHDCFCPSTIIICVLLRSCSFQPVILFLFRSQNFQFHHRFFDRYLCLLFYFFLLTVVAPLLYCIMHFFIFALLQVIRMQKNPVRVPGSLSSAASDSENASDDASVAADGGSLSAVDRCAAAMASAWACDHHTGESAANQSITAESLSMMGHMQAEVLRLSHVTEDLRAALEHCRACEQAMEQHNASLQAEIQQLKAIDRKSPLNMEYIRNVVVKYIETLDHHGLVPVIATVLQLEDPVRSRVLAVAMKRPASNTSFVHSIGGGAMSALSSLLPLPKNGQPSKN
jgi:hypothetical protein